MTDAVRPQWIAKMYPASVGRDHLGLGSVSSDQILVELSPGINVLTHHPRYFSFYVFLLDEFWRRKKPRSRREWSQFYRPRECIFSIGAHLCERPEHGATGKIIGAQKTAGAAERGKGEFDPQFNYIKSDLGGYGLYYRSVIAELGLIYPGGPGFPTPIDVPTESGQALAAAFRSAVEGTEYFRDYFEHASKLVPAAVVKEYIESACLCQLQLPDAPDRGLLLEFFLNGQDQGAAARRDTLVMLLDIAAQTDRQAVTQDDFRQLVYFGASNGGSEFRPSDKSEAVHARWRLYQAREYYTFAFNGLFLHVCEWGLENDGASWPIPISELRTHINASLTFSKVASLLGLPDPRLTPDADSTELLDWLADSAGSGSDDFDQACTLGSPIHEHRLYELALEHWEDAEVIVPAMVTLLDLVYLRFARPELWLKEEWEISRAGGETRLSLDGYFKALRRRRAEGLTLGDMVDWIVQDRVVLQHLLVASNKLPDNTFRFEREGDRLRFFGLENPLDFQDSRFDALSTTAHELGLCGDFGEERHRLRPEGQTLLRKGVLDTPTP